ncbi:hypothetical protein BCD67_04270 [Oscillatoriales cyanobacterium USR001]|nr:hypothetical protein BCD67_04270 [Oscillatoriales cyanobacterium USR001]
MNFEVVFNELCLRTPASDVQAARQLMSELLEILRTLKSQGIAIKFLTKSDFYQSKLAEGYTVSQWFKEQGKDLEALRLKSLIRDGWPLEEIADPAIDVRYELEEGSLEQTIGLAYAFVFNALAVSFRGSKWNSSRLIVKVEHIDEDEELTAEVIHACCCDHVQEHADWIKDRTRQEVRDGIDLWQRREDLFPNLIFCDAVQKQLQLILANDNHLRSVEQRLFELQNASKSWIKGSFKLDSLPCKATPESDSRLKQFKQQLTFSCPDGEKRLFSLHVRMTPGAWRLHFVDLSPGKIIIGYIGSKIQ